MLAPTGHTIAFVEGNDLYVTPAVRVDEAFEEAEDLDRLAKRSVRVTEDGGRDKFNGVCDWVYEEEVRFLLPGSLSCVSSTNLFSCA